MREQDWKVGNEKAVRYIGLLFKVTNRRYLSVTQDMPDGDVVVHSKSCSDDRPIGKYTLSAGDFVSVLNLFCYIHDESIRDGIVDPTGDVIDEILEEMKKRKG